MKNAELRSWLIVLLKFARHRPLGAIGAAIIVIMIIAALVADLIAPFDPLANDYAAMLQAPSAKHWFGTGRACARPACPSKHSIAPGLTRCWSVA